MATGSPIDRYKNTGLMLVFRGTPQYYGKYLGL